MGYSEYLDARRRRQAGVSLALPQDCPQPLRQPGHPSQFPGTQFSMGGTSVEGYPTVTYDGP